MEEDKPSGDDVDLEPLADEQDRESWSAGPDAEVPPDSWLALDDDALLHRIQTLGSEEDEDDQLLEVVGSHRHFFVRQEAAKRVLDRRRLFAFEDDRHVGQILVRHLNRREDLTYLERLALRGRHVEVRSAAQVQLARVWKKVESRQHLTSPGGKTGPAPAPATGPRPGTLSGRVPRPPTGTAATPGPLPVAPARPPTSAVVEADGVDGSVLGWAAHFIVEAAWSHLGTTATRQLLTQTQAELLGRHRWLSLFNVGADARVAGELLPGARVAREAVDDLAAWMVAFRRAAAVVAPEVRTTSLRACTSLMGDALREAGFYAACDRCDGALE